MPVITADVRWIADDDVKVCIVDVVKPVALNKRAVCLMTVIVLYCPSEGFVGYIIG